MITRPSNRSTIPSTSNIRGIFSVGFTRESSFHRELSLCIFESTNRIDFGIIGDHECIYLTPLYATMIVNFSTKLLDLPMPK